MRNVCSKTTMAPPKEVSIDAASTSGLSDVFSWLERCFHFSTDGCGMSLTYQWAPTLGMIGSQWETDGSSNRLPGIFWRGLPFSKPFLRTTSQMVRCNKPSDESGYEVCSSILKVQNLTQRATSCVYFWSHSKISFRKRFEYNLRWPVNMTHSQNSFIHENKTEKTEF